MRITTQFQFEPYKIVQDFEKVMINASKDQFQHAKHDGCKFLSKHTWQKKMKKLVILKEQISIAVENNFLDILTIIPTDEIRSKGIPHVKAAIESLGLSSNDKEKWEIF